MELPLCVAPDNVACDKDEPSLSSCGSCHYLDSVEVIPIKAPLSMEAFKQAMETHKQARRGSDVKQS